MRVAPRRAAAYSAIHRFPSREPLPKEIAMFYSRNTRLHTSALASAALVTLAILGFVDGLARDEARALELAAQKATPVATTTATPQA
jgi:hypothetical protein